jgi:DNA-binding MarR family transcriptional regulator
VPVPQLMRQALACVERLCDGHWSTQAASQLIDTLVLRRYLEPPQRSLDRRRMEIRLTGRGRIAAMAIRSATDATDATLAQLVTADEA